MLHPSQFLNNYIYETLRKEAVDAEKMETLTRQQLEIIYAEKYFKIWVPKKWDGLECTLQQGLQYIEALAWCDGSVGWTVTLCSGANWFCGFMDEDSAKKIFTPKTVCLSGSGRAGIATNTQNGFIINGEWQYATGSLHADYFTINCKINNNEKDIASFWLKKEEVEIIKNWHTMGMKATASNSFKVVEKLIPEDRKFIIAPETAKSNFPVYHFPFLQFAEATLCVNFSGMALRFLDLSKPVFTKKETAMTSERFDVRFLLPLWHSLQTEHNKLRKQFYEIAGQCWQDQLNKNSNENNLSKLSTISRLLAKNSKELVNTLYPYCGVGAANVDSELNRLWRDLHTAGQHSLLNYELSSLKTLP